MDKRAAGPLCEAFKPVARQNGDELFVGTDRVFFAVGAYTLPYYSRSRLCAKAAAAQCLEPLFYGRFLYGYSVAARCS